MTYTPYFIAKSLLEEVKAVSQVSLNTKKKFNLTYDAATGDPTFLANAYEAPYHYTSTRLLFLKLS